MTVYPGSIDSLPDTTIDATPTQTTHKNLHNNDADAIIAVETELGTNPRGTYADVKTRATDSVQKTVGADQTISPAGDYVGVAVKASGSQTTDLFQVRSSADTLITAIKSDGKIDAGVGYKVASSLLASTHLSDSALLARLDSPVFSGTPTAPTASLSDSSTKLATTAFAASLFTQFLPTGAIIPYTGALPAGFLDTDGASYLRASYATLFGVIGTTFGSADGTHFNVPDLQGRFPVGKGTHADVSTLANSDGVAVGSRRPRHAHGLGTFVVSLDSHNLTDSGHTHTTSSDDHSHNVTDPGHTHTKTDTGHTHNISASHSHTASGSSGNNSVDHTHTYNKRWYTSTGSDTSSSQHPLQYDTMQGYTSAPSDAHTHAITIWGDGGIGGGNPSKTASANLGAITVNSNTTGISYSSDASGITINSATTGVTVNSATTGLGVFGHVVTPSGSVGTTSSAPTESPAYLVLRYCIKT